jgi:hypothetical protein
VSLFNPDTFLESLALRDRELILALQALTLRFPANSLTAQNHERLDLLEIDAKNTVMDRIARSEVELSTLQTLCILSIVEFAGKDSSDANIPATKHSGQLTSTSSQTARWPRLACIYQ